MVKKQAQKSLYISKWVVKLLVPDFLIGHPNLFDNLQTLRKNPQFKPLRMMIVAWLFLALSVGSLGVYTVMNAPKSYAAGESWLTGGFPYRKSISIDHTKVGGGTENESNFPVLINLTGLSNINANGSDIRFTASDGITPLAREIELYSVGTLVAWVKIPTLSHTADTEIYMYYGSSTAAEPAASFTYGSQNVWDSNFESVWHLADPAHPIDSTSNNNNLTNVGTTGTSGQIDGAASYDGATTYMRSPISFPLVSGTLDVWFNSSVPLTYGVTSETYSLFSEGWNQLMWTNDEMQVAVDANGTRSEIDLTDSFTANTWYHIVATYDSVNNITKLYINGVLKGTAYYDGGNADFQTFMGFGVGYSPVFGWWDGVLDETRISSSARSAGWISTEYNNESSNSTFYSSVGAQESSVNTPTNSSPSNASTTVSLLPALVASAYYDLVGTSQADTMWQLDDNSNFLSPEWTRTAGSAETSTVVNSTNGTFANDLAGKTALAHNTTYYWRVMYKNSDGVWSASSTATTFTTNIINTPVNSIPASGATVVNLTPILTASAFSDKLRIGFII